MHLAPPPASAPASAPRPTPTKSTPVSSSPPFGLERRAHGTPGAGNLRTIGAAAGAKRSMDPAAECEPRERRLSLARGGPEGDRAGRRWISGLRPRDAEHQVVPRERRKVD